MKIRIAVLAALVLAFAALAMAADDPMVGTRKLNVAKSTQVPQFILKGATVKIEIKDTTLHAAWDYLHSDGKTDHREFTIILDGKERPSTDGRSDTVANTRVDRNTLDFVYKRDGKVIGNMHTSISSDGKTMTIVTRDKHQKGEEVIETSIFDKQ